MEFTREYIEKYLDSPVAEKIISKQGRGRFVCQILRPAKCIADIRSNTRRDEWIKGHDNVGKYTLQVWDIVINHLYEVEQNEKAKVKAEQDALIAQNKAKEAAAREAEAVNPRFTIEQIKSLASFMELCSIESIDLRKINSFFEAVHCKPLETKAAA